VPATPTWLQLAKPVPLWGDHCVDRRRHRPLRLPQPDGGTGFSWSEIDPDWLTWTARDYISNLDHPAAVRGFESDFNAMRRADSFVLVLPAGRSAHLELGWAAGAGKRTAILTRDGEEPEWMAKMVDLITDDLADIIEWLRPITGGLPPAGLECRPVSRHPVNFMAVQPGSFSSKRSACTALPVAMMC